MSQPKALLLCNGGHVNLPGNRDLLVDIFTRQAGLDLEVVPDTAELTPSRLGSVDLLLDYSGDPKVLATDEQLQAVMSTVEAGKPYLGMHAANLPLRAQMTYIRNNGGAWPDNPAPDENLNAMQIRYLEFLGSAFLTHPPLAQFGVRMVDADHAVTRGIGDFEIEDEQYEIVGNLQNVHMLMQSDSGRPLAYTKIYGKGNMVYIALGHGTAALGNPQLQRAYVQAARWLLGLT